MDKLVSVIIPVYNVEKYIERCLLSVKEQTYADIEVILIDDGSEDKSGEICDKFTQIDKRFCVIHKINEGISKARNIGIDESSGEYITFIDSDDYIHPRMIELMMKEMTMNDVDIVVSNYEDISEDEVNHHFKLIHQGAKDIKKEIFDVINIERISGRDAIIRKYLDAKYKIVFDVAWSKIFKRSCFATYRFPLGEIYEDTKTIYKILYKSDKVLYIDYPFYFYLRRQNSIMETNKYWNKERESAYYDCIDFLGSLNDIEILNCSIAPTLLTTINYYFLYGINDEERKVVRNSFKLHYRKYKKYMKASIKQRIRIQLFYVSALLYRIAYVNLYKKKIKSCK